MEIAYRGAEPLGATPLASRTAIVRDILSDEAVMAFTSRALVFSTRKSGSLEQLCAHVARELHRRDVTRFRVRITCCPKSVEARVGDLLYDAGVVLSPANFNCVLNVLFAPYLADTAVSNDVR